MNRWVLFVVAAALATASAEFPVGVWSNEAEGFDIVTVALRKDGRGFAMAAMAQATAPVRWHRDGDLVRIKMAAPPANPVAEFREVEGGAVLQLPGKEQVPLKKVSEEEPGDLEARYLERLAEEWREAMATRTETRQRLDSVAALEKAVVEFARDPAMMGSCVIHAGDLPAISLNRLNGKTSITIAVESANAEERTMGVTLTPVSEVPEVDFQKTEHVSGEKRGSLMKWAKDEGFEPTIQCYVANGLWGVEAVLTQFAVPNLADPQDVWWVVDHLRGEVFDSKARKFEVVVYGRKADR